MKCLVPCLVTLFFFTSQEIEASSPRNIGRARSILEILEHQPASIESWVEDRVYLCPERIEITREGAFVSDWNSAIPIPSLALDQNGPFILCSREEVNKEAQEHYDRAGRALFEGFVHSAYAGLNIECPPIAIYEGYQAFRSFKEFGNESWAGHEKERERDHGGQCTTKMD